MSGSVKCVQNAEPHSNTLLPTSGALALRDCASATLRRPSRVFAPCSCDSLIPASSRQLRYSDVTISIDQGDDFR